MEPVTYLHKLLVGDLKFMKENVSLVDSILQIMLLTLKTSQKRKIYQPHFTLSFDCLFQIYQALDVSNTASPSASSQVGLKAMLMSSPPVDIFQKVSYSAKYTCIHSCMFNVLSYNHASKQETKGENGLESPMEKENKFQRKLNRSR